MPVLSPGLVAQVLEHPISRIAPILADVLFKKQYCCQFYNIKLQKAKIACNVLNSIIVLQELQHVNQNCSKLLLLVPF